MRARPRLGAAAQRLVPGLRDTALGQSAVLRDRIVEVLLPTNPFGIKAGGEGGCTPALAVVVSAILDALASLGVHDITMPATPFKVWQAIRDAKAEASGRET